MSNNTLYIALAVLAVLLIGGGVLISIIQKNKKHHSLFQESTRKIEVLDFEVKKPRSIEKPVIISSTVIEESLEGESEERN